MYSNFDFKSDSNQKLQFDIGCTENLLERKEIFLEGEITNPHLWPIAVDNSFHSIIKKIEVYDQTGREIEVINEYDFFMGNIKF